MRGEGGENKRGGGMHEGRGMREEERRRRDERGKGGRRKRRGRRGRRDVACTYVHMYGTYILSNLTINLIASKITLQSFPPHLGIIRSYTWNCI